MLVVKVLAHMLVVEVDMNDLLPLDALETCAAESGFVSLLIMQRRV